MNGIISSRAVRRIFVVVLVAAALVLLTVWVRRATRDQIVVRTAKVQNGDIVSSVSTNGKVSPVQLFQAHSSEPQQVQALYVHVGQVVPAGTLLLKLDSSEAIAKVATARSNIAAANASEHDIRQGGSQDERIGLTGDVSRARTQVDESQKQLAVLQQLQARGAASANEVAGAQERLVTAQASLASAQQRSTARYAPSDQQKVAAQLADSNAGLSAAQGELANSLIRAPFTGTVFSLPVRLYDYVATGEELVQVADLTRMQVQAYFDEPEIGKLRLNDAVVLTWEARPGRVWHGHIVRVPTTVSTYGTRNVGECMIAVDDPTGDLLPNTNVTARVTTQEVHNVLTMPRDALRTSSASQSFVFLYRDGALHKQAVQVGAFNLQSIQITSGLQPGDVVALNAVSNADLTDGLQVTEAN